MYTPVSKAKLNALDPGTYLRHVIARIAKHPVNRVRLLFCRPRAVIDVRPERRSLTQRVVNSFGDIAFLRHRTQCRTQPDLEGIEYPHS
jgi:hypothetical protein